MHRGGKWWRRKWITKERQRKKVAGRDSTRGSLKEKSVPQDLCFYCQAALINGLPSSSQPAAWLSSPPTPLFSSPSLSLLPSWRRRGLLKGYICTMCLWIKHARGREMERGREGANRARTEKAKPFCSVCVMEKTLWGRAEKYQVTLTQYNEGERKKKNPSLLAMWKESSFKGSWAWSERIVRSPALLIPRVWKRGQLCSLIPLCLINRLDAASSRLYANPSLAMCYWQHRLADI